jgi:hypothetical protein
MTGSAKPSISSIREKLDCFVAVLLAMTTMRFDFPFASSRLQLARPLAQRYRGTFKTNSRSTTARTF